MNLLIAGSSGIIGKALCSSFQGKYNYVGISSEEDQDKNHFKVDLCDAVETFNFVDANEKFDILVFLVGLAHSKGKGKDLNKFIHVNYNTLVNLLNACEKCNKIPNKIIYSSTISVYGEKWNETNYDESTELNPKSPYARTKKMAEEILSEKYNVKAWILRFAPVYSDKFTLNIDRRTKIRKIYYTISNGTKKLSLLNIKNIIDVIDAIINNKIPIGTYNIADKRNYIYSELLIHQKAIKYYNFPCILVFVTYIFGKLLNANFLIENSIKLGTDNIYSSSKIQKYIEIKYKLFNNNNE